MASAGIAFAVVGVLAVGSLTAQVRPLPPGGERPIDPARAAAQALGQGVHGPPAPERQPPAPVQYPADFIGPLPADQQAAAPVVAAQDPPGQDPPVPVPVRPLPGQEGAIDPARAAEQTLTQGRVLYGPPPPPEVPDPTRTVPITPLPIPDAPVDPAVQAGEALRGALPGSGAFIGPLAEAPPPAAPQASLVEAGYPVHGQVRLGYRYRHVSNDDTDQDLQGSVSLDFGDPARHPVTGHFYGAGWWDIDGFDSPNLLNGIQETYDRDYGGFIYDAYVDLHMVDSLSTLRLGRQSLLDTPAILYLDGVRVETAESEEEGLWAGGYLGSPTRFFRSSGGDDLAGGVYAGARPWQGGRLRIDWMHLEEQAELSDLRDDLVAASFWQSFGTANAHVRWSWLEGDSRDVLVQARGTVPAADMLLSVNYFEQFITLGRLPVEIDPYFESAFLYQPYRQVNLLTSKGFGEQFSIDAGFAFRRLSDSSDEGQFNREFEHLFLTPIVHAENGAWALSLTGDIWSSDGEDTSTVTADFTVDFSEQVRTSVGTGYSLFKYDSFSGREKDHVRDVYFRLDYAITPATNLDFTYSYENDDLEDYHTLRVFTTWSF